MTWKKPLIVEQPVALEAAAYACAGYDEPPRGVAPTAPPLKAGG